MVYEQTRFDRRAVGAAAATASTAATPPWPPGCGSSPHHQWHSLAGSDGRSLAGPAKGLWTVADGGHPLLSLATRRHLGPHSGRVAGTRRPGREAGLAIASCRWHHCSSASARGWCAKKGIDHLRYPDEALGRSQGGFSTKIHIRAEGGGKPLVLLLTAGQRHEQIMFEA